MEPEGSLPCSEEHYTLYSASWVQLKYSPSTSLSSILLLPSPLYRSLPISFFPLGFLR
jgi:hypothetical protein